MGIGVGALLSWNTHRASCSGSLGIELIRGTFPLCRCLAPPLEVRRNIHFSAYKTMRGCRGSAACQSGAVLWVMSQRGL